MSAGLEKLLLLTLEGPVTVCFMDGQLLEGELLKQDLFNYYLMVEGEVRMISRSQVRYIKGESGQNVVPDIDSQKAFSEAEPASVPTVDKSVFDTAEVSRPAAAAMAEEEMVGVADDQEASLVEAESPFDVEPATDQPASDVEAEEPAVAATSEVEEPVSEITPEVAGAEVEPEVDQEIPGMAAEEVEPEEDQVDSDLLADMLAEELALQAEQPAPPVDPDRTALDYEPLNPVEDTGATFVLPEPTEFVEAAEGGVEDEAAASLYDWDEATMVLGEHEEADENEITAVLGLEAKKQVIRRLVLSTGPHAGEQFELTRETITLGRARDNDIPLSLDKEVSRRHAVMKLEGNRYVIQDQNSLNGTYVNNQRIGGPQPLEDGDVIFIGVSDIIYQED
jgi:hypothetical protein